MDKLESLRAGIAEMRTVAQKLSRWADDLERTFQDEEAQSAKEVPEQPAPAEKKRKPAAGKAAAEPAAVPGGEKELKLPEVRAILAEKCAAGFGTQVKALIESYGASSLKEVPAEKYEELLEAVKDLGDADAG